MNKLINAVSISKFFDRVKQFGCTPDNLESAILETGEEIKIPASKKVAFRVASSLKEAVGVKKKSSTAKAPAKKKK